MNNLVGDFAYIRHLTDTTFARGTPDVNF